LRGAPKGAARKSRLREGVKTNQQYGAITHPMVDLRRHFGAVLLGWVASAVVG
jgi:hypothetical protein